MAGHDLFATGTIGRILTEELGLRVTCFQSGRWAATSRSAR